METILTDSGPLVALLNHRDAHHGWAREQFSQLAAPVVTCEGVITEASYLLQSDGLPPWGVVELMERGIANLEFDLESNLRRIRSLMRKYADTPMDFVDACLVVMTEGKRECRLLTLDSDFRLYRRFERQAIPLITPAKWS